MWSLSHLEVDESGEREPKQLVCESENQNNELKDAKTLHRAVSLKLSVGLLLQVTHYMYNPVVNDTLKTEASNN